jgi:hypothetical protein
VAKLMMIFFWYNAKTVAGSYIRVRMGDLIVWAPKLDPNLTKIPLESSHQELLIGVIKMRWFQCEMILYSFMKVKM